MKISIVITGLSIGGAETMLLKLLERIDRNAHSFHVFSLTDLGEIGPRIQALGIPVEALGMRRGAPSPFAVLRLARRLRQVEAELVHTWMYHADLLGGIAARMAGVRVIVWCIRNSTLDRDKTRLSTRMVVRVNALASHWLPSGVVSCAEAARDYHVALGYAADKMAVIPNGFDLSRFHPDADARASVRAELGLPTGTLLVGVVGRYDPQKNHTGFLEAAASVKRRHPEAHFVLVGAGLDRRNAELAAVAESNGVAKSVHWLGSRQDIARLMASLDVLVSSSRYGEAFPNVLGEAMSCCVPCVVTDVGDSAVIVGDTGRVVAAGDMQSLAAAVADLLALGADLRATLGHRARARVQEHFEIGQVVRRYEDYYAQLARRAA